MKNRGYIRIQKIIFTKSFCGALEFLALCKAPEIFKSENLSNKRKDWKASSSDLMLLFDKRSRMGSSIFQFMISK
uniref:Ribosomal protein L32 n=1 Tax=Romanomermis culicivorax TaxID=13658 RepID=A0A915JC78_ROMCU